MIAQRAESVSSLAQPLPCAVTPQDHARGVAKRADYRRRIRRFPVAGLRCAVSGTQKDSQRLPTKLAVRIPSFAIDTQACAGGVGRRSRRGCRRSGAVLRPA